MILVDNSNQDIQAKDLTLSVVLNKGSFYYCLNDMDSGHIKQLYGQNFQFDTAESSLNPIADHLLAVDSLEQSRLENIKIGVESSFFTLVPQSMYLADEASLYFKNIGYLTQRDKILSLPLDDLDSVFLFTVDQYLLSRILTKWPQAYICHLAYPVLLLYLKRIGQEDGDSVFLHVYDNKVYCGIFKKKKIQYFNVFKFENSDDFIYHTALLYRQYQLDRSEDKLWISGQLMRDSDIIKKLMKYISNIEFMSFDGASDFTFLDEKRPAHFYFDLFALSTCA